MLRLAIRFLTNYLRKRNEKTIENTAMIDEIINRIGRVNPFVEENAQLRKENEELQRKITETKERIVRECYRCKGIAGPYDLSDIDS